MAIEITNKLNDKPEIIYLSTDNESKEPHCTSNTYGEIQLSNDNNVCTVVQKEDVKDLNVVDQPIEKPSESLEFPCTQCGKIFKHETSLKSHLIKHGKKLKCEVCGKEFNCK